MSKALDPAAYIFEGIWTDWTKGSITGVTLTLCPTRATLLTNILTLFVTFAGGQLWTIIRFMLHQLRTSPRSEVLSATHSQQQLVLRNATTDLATVRLMLRLAWTSRRSRENHSSRTVLIAVVALLHAALFMVAGTFSNKAISAGPSTTNSTVLSRSKYCGVWNETYFDIAALGPGLDELAVQYWAKQALNVQLSLEYAQECYIVQPSYYMSSTCNTMRRASLNWTSSEGTCPFQQHICQNNSKVVVLDTGVIDSHKDLGINSRPKDRLTYQRVTTCAALNDTNYVKGWDILANSSEVSPEDTAYAYYGRSLSQGTDWTYSYSNFASAYTDVTSQVTTPYQLSAQMALSNNPIPSDFAPIPEIAQESADLTLLFLSYTGRYVEQIEDPWFSAHQLHLFNTHDPAARKQYARDLAISTLGCTQQHKFCTTSGICTPFLGFEQVQKVEAFNSALTSHQNVAFDRILRAVTASSIYEIVLRLAKTRTPMRATDATATFSYVLSLGLPDDQWQKELEYWHSIAMAQLQRTVVQWGTGQIAPEPKTQLLRPQTEADTWFCTNLMIPSGVYQSFSVFSISLILSLGTLAVIVSWTIEDITGWLQKRLVRLHPREQWDRDDMLKWRNLLDESSWRPQPPPKDYNRPSASQLRVRGESLELAVMSSGPHSNGIANDQAGVWARSPSSEALPPEDRTSTFIGCQPGPRAPRTRVRASPRAGPERNSFFAISLSSVDAERPEISTNIFDRSQTQFGYRPTAEIYIASSIYRLSDSEEYRFQETRRIPIRSLPFGK